MTNLPTNPTKTEITEKYWYQFLLYLKSQMESFGDYGPSHVQPTESWFWDWYIAEKLEPPHAG